MSSQDHNEFVDELPLPPAQKHKQPITLYAFAAGLVLMIALLALSY